MAKRKGKSSVNVVPDFPAGSKIGSFTGKQPGSRKKSGKGPVQSPTNDVSSNMAGLSPGPVGTMKGSTKPPGNPNFKSSGR